MLCLFDFRFGIEGNFKLGQLLHNMPFNGTLFRRADQCLMVFLRESVGYSDIDLEPAEHFQYRIPLHSLKQPDAFRRKVMMLTG